MKTIWIALIFVATCAGIFAGATLRSRQESEASPYSSSELLALRTGSSGAKEGKWFPATAYYDQVRRIVEADYVEEIGDETKMARMSLRYLLRSLGDPETRYYAPEEWSAYMGRLSGKYEGIGVDLNAQEAMTPAGLTLPLKIVSVAPGGPAEAAGLQPGDSIESIDGRWVATRSLFEELQRASDAFAAKKLTREQYDKIWQKARDRSEHLMTVEEAVKTLYTAKGKVSVEVRRGAELLKKDILARSVEVPAAEFSAGVLRINWFGPGSAEAIARAVGDAREVTVDVRRNPGGSLDEVKKALAELTPGGAFAKLRHEPNAPLDVVDVKGHGDIKVSKILVGPGTAREAEVFASGLSALTGAPMEGGPTAGLGRKIERFSLPDGSGYTITSGHFFNLKGETLVREDQAALEARAKAEEASR